jgi:hypothetical protein
MSATPDSLARFLPFREFITLDVRSLALFRILLACLILLDWFDRIPDLEAHYSDEGVVPRDLLAGTFYAFSIHLFSGEVWYQGLLTGVGILFALGLLLGYQTPLMCLLNFLLLVSIHGRNHALMQGGDHLVRCMLLWSIFLPLGAVWSLDARHPDHRPRSPLVCSLASAILIGQIVIVYLFAAVWKWDEQWRERGTALYVTLTNEQFTTRFGYLVRSQPWLCTILTHFTIYLETLGPALLFLPFHVGFQRMIAVGLFLGFHAGIGLCMELALFPFAGMAIWTALIPPSFWDRLGGQMPDLGRLLPTWIPERAAPVPGWQPPTGVVPTTILALLATYILLFNIQGYLVTRQQLTGQGKPLIPIQFSQLGTITGLEQGWGLFAPRPTPVAGWHVALGTRADGTKVELLRGSDPADTSQPPLQSTTYRNGRWRRLTQVLGVPEFGALPVTTARYLMKEWNRNHPNDSPVVKVELYFHRYPTYEPNQERPKVEEVWLATYPAEEKKADPK